ncbi:MAG TPA: hypothetical protein VF843_04100 [Streptosporangiaceae bacterium]
MNGLGLFALAVLLPTITGYAGVIGVRAWRRFAEARRRPPPAEPLDRLVARLRRLRAELEAVENTPRGPARQHKLRAIRGAYLDVLRSACDRLEVSPPPGGDRARQADIYRAEAGLRERGVEVRATASR